MSKLLVILRLGRRDLRHRPGQAAMLAVIVAAATAALTLGLVLQGTTAHPFQATRSATSGPDALVTDFPAGLGAPADPAALGQVAPLARAPGVVAHSGPFPVAFPVLSVHGHADAGLDEGRGRAPVAVDQPELTQGSWMRPGAAVIERSFADALGVRVGGPDHPERQAVHGRRDGGHRRLPGQRRRSSSKAASSGPTRD